MQYQSIQKYYKVAEKLKRHAGTKMESTVSQPFYELLNEYVEGSLEIA
jgi:hypothetical protein